MAVRLASSRMAAGTSAPCAATAAARVVGGLPQGSSRPAQSPSVARFSASLAVELAPLLEHLFGDGHELTRIEGHGVPLGEDLRHGFGRDLRVGFS